MKKEHMKVIKVAMMLQRATGTDTMVTYKATEPSTPTLIVMYNKHGGSKQSLTIVHQSIDEVTCKCT